MAKQTGFSLIELMAVVAITGILLAIAIPGYKTYVLKSHRADALNALSQDQAILERCYAQSFSYNGACAARPAFPHNSAQGYYSISAVAGSSTFTLTATAIGTQVDDTTCASLSIDQANQKTAVDSSGTSQPVCWNL